MDRWVTQWGDDPLRFLLIVIITMYFVCFFSPLPACPSSCARRDKDKEVGTRLSFTRRTFSGIRRRRGADDTLPTHTVITDQFIRAIFSLATSIRHKKRTIV